MKSSEFYNKTAWKWFSKFMKLYYSNNGVCQCATCGVFKSLGDSKLHLGHLIKVFEGGGNTNFSVAFDERNCMPQCYVCNCKKGGNELKMMEAIERKHGKGTYDELRIKSNKPYKLDSYTLKDISDRYREKYKSLEKLNIR